MGNLDRFAPPGMGISGIRRWTIGSIVVSTLFSLMFLPGYFTELAELYRYMEYPVYAELTMTPFQDLIVVPMSVFRLAPLVPLLFVIFNYNYFYEESKSIYLMKRLNRSWALHIRCLTLPILGALLVVAAGAILYFVYLLVYRICTPEILLPANL